VRGEKRKWDLKRGGKSSAVARERLEIRRRIAATTFRRGGEKSAGKGRGGKETATN